MTNLIFEGNIKYVRGKDMKKSLARVHTHFFTYLQYTLLFLEIPFRFIQKISTKNTTRAKHEKIREDGSLFYTCVYTILPTGSANEYICIGFVLRSY